MFPGPSTGPDLVLWYQVDQLAGRLFRVFLSILNHLVIAYNPQVVPPIPLPVPGTSGGGWSWWLSGDGWQVPLAGRCLHFSEVINFLDKVDSIK